MNPQAPGQAAPATPTLDEQGQDARVTLFHLQGMGMIALGSL